MEREREEKISARDIAISIPRRDLKCCMMSDGGEK